MPNNNLVEECSNWFKGFVQINSTKKRGVFDLLIPQTDLYKSDIPALQNHSSSHLWRFRPSSIVIEIDKSKTNFHVLVVTSNSIALKDVGELNCYVRIMGATSGCLVSPKGISNEVRLVQADAQIRNRLFRPNEGGNLFLIEWDHDRGTVVPESIIPIETLIGKS